MQRKERDAGRKKERQKLERRDEGREENTEAGKGRDAREEGGCFVLNGKGRARKDDVESWKSRRKLKKRTVE